MITFLPHIEIIPIDPNCLAEDWDDYSTAPSSSSGFKSHENGSVDLFEEEDVPPKLLNPSYCKDVLVPSKPSDPSLGKLFSRCFRRQHVLIIFF